MLRSVLVDDIKKQIAEAMKSGDAVAPDVLRFALSEIQMAEARKNAPVSEEDASNAVRKLIESNEETLGLTADAERAATLRQEIGVVGPSEAALGRRHRRRLDMQREAIRAAANDGQATGIAMKYLKSAGGVSLRQQRRRGREEDPRLTTPRSCARPQRLTRLRPRRAARGGP